MTKGRLKKGIFYGWIIVAVAMATSLAAGPAQGSVFSVFMGPIAEDFGWSRTFVASTASLAILVSALLVFVAGPFLDKYGPRHLMVAMGLVMGLGSIGVALSNDRLSFTVSYVAVRSVGVGLVVLVTTTAVANWFVRKRGRAMAMNALAMPLSIAILAPLSQMLMSHLHWSTLWFFFSAFAFAVFLPGSLLLYRRPEDRGLLPDGDVQPEERPGPGRPLQARDSGLRATEPQWTARQAMGTATFWVLALTTAVFYLASASVAIHQTSFMVDRGMAPTAAASIVGLYALFAGAGTLLGGYIAERFPAHLGLSWSFASTGVALVALLWFPIPAGPVVYALLFGTALGIRSTLEPVIWAAYYGRSSLGAIRGISSLFLMLGNAMGPVLAGMIYDRFGTYLPFFFALAIACWIGAGTILLAKPPIYRPIASKP